MAKLLGKIAIYVDGPEDRDEPKQEGSFSKFNRDEHEYEIHIRGNADAALTPFPIAGAEPSILAHEVGHAIAAITQTPAENGWVKARQKYFEPFLDFIGVPQPHNNLLRDAKIKQEREAWEIGEKVLTVTGAKLNKKVKEAALQTYEDYEA